MRGSVIKRGKSWSVVVELPPDPETGKRRQRWHSGYRTRKEAERARIELLSIVDSGTYVDHSRETLAEFIADWLPAIERTIRPATLHSYERNLRLHVTPYVGELPLPKVDAGVLNGLYARLLKEGRRDRQGGLSPRTVRYVHTILHRALKDGTKWGRIARNPADAANAPRAAANAAPEMTTWAAGELRTFLEQNAEDRLYAPRGYC